MFTANKEYELGELLEQIESTLIQQGVYDVFHQKVETDLICTDSANGYGKVFASWMPVSNKQTAKKLATAVTKNLKKEQLDKCFTASYGNLNSDWENANCVIIESNPDVFNNDDLLTVLTLYRMKYGK